MPRSSVALRPSMLALGLLAAACSGKGAPPPSSPAEGAAAPAPRAPQDGEGAPVGVQGAYVGAGYGGQRYGAIAQPSEDPCADPCGPLVVAPPPPPQDPPELAAYLPPSGPRPAGSPDPATRYAVPLHDSPSMGPAAAPVTLVTTYEFADPFSNRLRPTFDELSARYGADLKIVWKHFIVHRDRAQASALAGCAAAKQGKFQPFMNAMFAASTAPGGNRRWDTGAIQIVATGQGLDLARFDADLRSKACKAEVLRDQQLFESLGQYAVPVSWVNGRPLQGAQPAHAFAALIDEELALARAALARRGAKLADYYPSLVKAGRTAP